MIVRSGGGTLQLITQPDHAHLARRIMEQCVPLSTRTRRDAILHAIGEHDNGWAEEDASPTADPVTGRIVDFVSAPLAMRQRVWPRGVARLAGDPWAAALVAQHALTVYDRYHPDADWSSFFATMTDARDAMQRASGVPLDDLLDDYAFVRLADLISLTFCAGWTDEQRFRDWRILATGTRILVSPDAFGGAVIPIAISAIEIPDRPYRSDDDLRATLDGSHDVILAGQLTA